MKLLAWFSKREHDKKRQIKLIAASSYFDAEWYYKQNPDVARAGVDAAKHYFTIGWKEGRNPSPKFNTSAYLRTYPELVSLDINPLVYFLVVEKKVSTKHKISLSPKDSYFDSSWYAEHYPDYVKETDSPYRHYLKYGWKLGYNPSRNFDTNFYLKMYPDVAKAGVNPLLHFMRKGFAERRLPKLKVSKKYYSPSYLLIAKSEYFDKRWYIKHNPDLDFKTLDPVEHYLRYGWKENRNPSKKFSGEDYFINNPDVEIAQINPLLHYERSGRAEGRVIVKANLYHAYGWWYNLLRLIGRSKCAKEIDKNKKAKILVHLHMFYANAWPEIKEYLQNLSCYNYDLTVTGNNMFMQSEAYKEIKAYKPETRFIECVDKGFDIGPFMEVLQETDLNRYDIIYHFHSKGAAYGKGRITYKRMFIGTAWFRQLFSGCLGVFNVHRGIDVLFNSDEYGIIGADNLVFNDTLARQRVVKEFAKRLKIEVKDDYQFIGGSCFGAKSKVLQQVKRLGLSLNSFDYSKRNIFTLAHAMERIMVITGLNMGYKIYPLPVKYDNHESVVQKHLAKLEAQDTVIAKKLSEFGVSEPLSLNMDIVSGLHCTFYQGIYKNKPVFIKWGGNSEIAANEAKMQKMFYCELGAYVPEVLIFDKEAPFVVTPYLQGYNLEELRNLGIYEKEKQIIIKSLQDMKNKLKFSKLIHRDIRPANLFFSDNKLYLLDYQFATTLDDDNKLQELEYVKQHPNIARDLGDMYRESSSTWNDAFSIDLIINEVSDIKAIDAPRKAKTNKIRKNGKGESLDVAV